MPELMQEADGKQRESHRPISLPHLLLLAGSGREVGKTSLGCAIVQSMVTPPVVLKVSSHFHPITSGLRIIRSDDKLHIAREYDTSGEKDSSRYLRAGASEVYYIQCRAEELYSLALWIESAFPPSIPLISESAALGSVVIPGFAIFIDGGSGKKQPSWDFPAMVMPPVRDKSLPVIPVIWRNNKWEKQ